MFALLLASLLQISQGKSSTVQGSQHDVAGYYAWRHHDLYACLQLAQVGASSCMAASVIIHVSAAYKHLPVAGLCLGSCMLSPEW